VGGGSTMEKPDWAGLTDGDKSRRNTRDEKNSERSGPENRRKLTIQTGLHYKRKNKQIGIERKDRNCNGAGGYDNSDARRGIQGEVLV